MTRRTEADICRTDVLPKLYAAGWDDEQINEQRTFTDGRIKQCRIVKHLYGLHALVDQRKVLQAQPRAEFAALFSSVLDKAFKGKL